MRVSLVTLFPEAFESFLGVGLLAQAIDKGALSVTFSNPRDFTEDSHRTVDDAPYGGGSGMVLMAGPIAAALDAADEGSVAAHRVLLTPQGALFSHAHAARLATREHVAFVCGRYEGVDERVRGLVHEELSMGDYVLLGGEVPAMAVIEATARLLPGVLGNEASAQDESHVAGQLEYPQYTRPRVFREQPVPDVLLSGDHAAIDRWRRRQALVRTRERRPDLFAALSLSDADRALLNEDP